MPLSPDALLLRRPFEGHRALCDEEASWLSAAWGVLRWLVVVGCFVSWTTSGGLVADHLVFAPLSWAFAPVLQGLFIVFAARIAGARMPAPRLVTLYFHGHGPWMIVLLAISSVCLFAPEPSILLLGAGTLGIGLAMVAAMIWCALLTYALLRAGCALGRWRAATGTLAFYLGYSASLVSWYAVTGQLAPILGWVT